MRQPALEAAALDSEYCCPFCCCHRRCCPRCQPLLSAAAPSCLLLPSLPLTLPFTSLCLPCSLPTLPAASAAKLWGCSALRSFPGCRRRADLPPQLGAPVGGGQQGQRGGHGAHARPLKQVSGKGEVVAGLQAGWKARAGAGTEAGLGLAELMLAGTWLQHPLTGPAQ